jgi:hypothetical protein
MDSPENGTDSKEESNSRTCDVLDVEEESSFRAPFMKRPFYKDLSFWVLIFSNMLTIQIALTKNWSLMTIVAVYWAQSCIIGVFNFLRILNLKTFSTEGFTINNQSVLPTEETKRKTATFFAFHYGFFHFIYAFFVFPYAVEINFMYVLAAGGIFFVDHFFSFRYNKKRDEQKVRNIGRIMFFPYARIIPMHLTILTYGIFSPGEGSLLLFLGLKTAADAVMHVIEHES